MSTRSSLRHFLYAQIQVNDKKSGYIKQSRVEKFILLVGSYEDKIFKKRSELRDRNLRRLCYNNGSVSAWQTHLCVVFI